MTPLDLNVMFILDRPHYIILYYIISLCLELMEFNFEIEFQFARWEFNLDFNFGPILTQWEILGILDYFWLFQIFVFFFSSYAS